MASRKVLPIVFRSFLLFFCVFVTLNFVIAANAAIFVVRNNCPYTVWAAGVPGGGKRLNQNETWFVVAKPGQRLGRIWARTNCSFDIFGQGRCKTGDCNGLLKCKSYGQAPNTLAEYAIGQSDQDFFDISVVDGFNVPIKFSSLSRNCSQVIRCTGDIIKQCPNELKVTDGCNGPCPVFKTNEFCCNSGNCKPTYFSRFFKERCPDVYSYPKDDSNSTFVCPTGSHYEVTFCPLTDIQANGTEFEVRNYCPYTVWAAAVPGGGKRLNQGNTWTISISSGTKQGRIWARTNCNFDSSGRGQCQTGDCNGVLQCMSFGQSPTTLAEYTLDQFANQDFIDISVINGFNVPMEFSSISGQCSRVIRCSGNITKECPNELEVPGGCNGPCMVFNTEKYCCNSGNCEPTSYSKFFKDRCPNAYSYPKDDATSLFTCPTGTNYNVIFCP